MKNGKVIMLCGKVGSGKSFYSDRLKKKINGVVLSCDKLMLSFFEENFGERHEAVLKKTKAYLYELAYDIAAAETNVILDFGFWTRRERDEVTDFFNRRDIETELYYIKTTDDVQRMHIENRNKADSNNYYFSETTVKKFNDIFEEPQSDEDFIMII